MPVALPSRPLRLFLDTGVLIQGHFRPYSSAHGILVLTTQRTQFQAIIAEPVVAEFDRWLRQQTKAVPAAEAARLMAGVEGWMQRARPTRVAWPSAEELASHTALL